MKHFLHTLIISGLFLCLLPIKNTQARVDILPRKIVMEPRDRSAEITVLNLFDKSGTFRVDIIHHKQNEDGTYTLLENPLSEDFDPSSAVRYSPRQFTLPPGGRQKIRISLRKPTDLPEGEYRFHVKTLRFAGLDDEAKEINTNLDGPKVFMKMNMGVSIPVIVRHGSALFAQASLSDVELLSADKTQKGTKPELHFTISREGNKGTMGTIKVFWQPSGAQERQIGIVSNMNLFTDITQRQAQVPLSELPRGTGTIRVIYTDDFSDTVFDEIILQQ